MLPASVDRIHAALGPDDAVLDVGGGWAPFARADHVLDLLPYRRVEGARYSEATWTRVDMCDRRPWPYSDGQFDFAVCSHTLEDVRDPIWVCGELSRVARAGYVEVPSRLTEQAVGVQGPWAGYSHHRWLVDRLDDGTLEFVFKTHALDGDPQFQVPSEAYWSAPEEERVLAVFWEGEVRARERIFVGAEEHDDYLRAALPGGVSALSSRPRRSFPRLRRSA